MDADLSAAGLDACRFVNCDLSTLRLPVWPCFTVRDPEEELRAVLDQLPGVIM